MPSPRRLVQLAVAAGLVLLPFANRRGFSELSGNLLSFELWGFPVFDPLASLQAILGGAPPAKPLLGLVVPLGLAFFFGAVFCSWLCPYGLLSELAHGLRTRIKPLPAVWGRNFAHRKLLGWGLVLLVVAGLGLPPLVNQASLPGWWGRVFQTLAFEGAWSGGLALLSGMLGLELALGRRLWCRTLCPQALVPMLVQRLSPLSPRLAHRAATCVCAKGREACAKSCSLGLDPKSSSPALFLECSNCGDCAKACARLGVPGGPALGRVGGLGSKPASTPDSRPPRD